MTRLPINFLLYLISGGLALGSAWTFYDTMTRPQGLGPKEIADQAGKHILAGREQTPDDRRDGYGATARTWWENFKEANFTGAVKVTEQPAENPVAEVAETMALLPIADILDVVGIAYDSSGKSRCVVRYKPSADVHPPVEVATPRPAAGGYAGPQDTRPVADKRKPPPGMPAFASQNQGVIQILEVGEALWPSYQAITLARVQEDGLAVYFRRIVDDGGEKEEKVFPNELGLEQDVLEELSKGGVRVSLRPRSGTGGAPAVAGGGDWVDVTETRAVKPGHWHISREDNDYLRDNAKSVFNDEVSLRSYVSRSGSMSGLQITRVSPRLEGLGVRSGDVILELNGVKVTTKAQAIKVGKQQYRRGVRTFVVKILTGYGRIEERTYYAPNE